MGELVEQELSEKKKLEDELHRKNDIIKTFVNQEFNPAQSTTGSDVEFKTAQSTTGPDVCTTALNSSIYNILFDSSDNNEGVEG